MVGAITLSMAPQKLVCLPLSFQRLVLKSVLPPPHLLTALSASTSTIFNFGKILSASPFPLLPEVGTYVENVKP